MEPNLFLCACHSPEHQLLVTCDEGFVYLEVHLAKLPLRKRIAHAFRYVFGYRSQFGDFDEILLNEETAHKLGSLLTKFRSTTYGEAGMETVGCDESRTGQ